jgi:hypothetical protein
VYQAEMRSHTGIDTEVALKVLRRDVAPGGQAVQRLRDEGKLLARLNHPAILRVHDLVLLEGRVSLVTEFVDGEDLDGCIRGADPIPLRPLLEVLALISGALDAAYNAPIGEDGRPLRLVHRDIKPSNIRLSRHGDCKLLDFGIARTDEVTREARTGTDMMIGSPAYMAPERFLDALPRPASDVFALGATLWEGLAGRRMFDMPVTVQASHAIDRGRYSAWVDARMAEVEAPDDVLQLIRDAVAFAPDDRPDAAELARRCDQLADDVGGPPLARWCRERRWPPPGVARGELEGRTLTEGTVAPPASDDERGPTLVPMPLPTPPPPASSSATRRVGLFLGGFSVVSLGVAAAAALASTIGIVAWLSWPPPEPEPVPEPEPEVAPEPEVVPEPEPEPEPEPTPAPTRPRPVARAPDPEPEPVPAPVAAPPPAPAQPEPVFVDSTGDVPALLVRGAERVSLPGRVRPGTWTVWAPLFGPEPTETRTRLEVVPGGAHAVSCSARMSNCTAK